MPTKIGEEYVIQYQHIQRELWYDDPAFPHTFVLYEAQSQLKDNAEAKIAQRRGVRYRIVKRTTYEESV